MQDRTSASSSKTPCTARPDHTSGSNSVLRRCPGHDCFGPPEQTWPNRPAMSQMCRLCCKSHFVLMLKNSAGRRFAFRVRMRGTSSAHAKRTGDFGNATEAIRIGDQFPSRVFAKNFEPCNFRLLQQYLPGADSCTAAYSARERALAIRVSGFMERDASIGGDFREFHDLAPFFHVIPNKLAKLGKCHGHWSASPFSNPGEHPGVTQRCVNAPVERLDNLG
jgi:hypothetical protein